MGVAGAVDHPRPRLGHERPGQDVAHPVPALHPPAVVPVARGLEPRPHGEQVLDGDAALRGVVDEVGEEAIDGVVDAQVSAVDRDADQQRDQALGRGLQVGGPVRPRAVEVALDHERPVDRDEQRPHARQLCHLRQDRLERRVRLDAADASSADRAEQRQTRGHRRARRVPTEMPQPASPVVHEAQSVSPAEPRPDRPARPSQNKTSSPGPCSAPSRSDRQENRRERGGRGNSRSTQPGAILPLTGADAVTAGRTRPSAR